MGVMLKRVYEPPASADGMRILVDRLWPRGLSKDKAKVDHWLKEVKGVKYYFRYMDDMVIFGSSKEELHKLKRTKFVQ